MGEGYVGGSRARSSPFPPRLTEVVSGSRAYGPASSLNRKGRERATVPSHPFLLGRPTGAWGPVNLTLEL